MKGTFKTCNYCQIDMQRGYRNNGGHMQYHDPRYKGFDCLICGRHHDEDGKLNRKVKSW